jgi:hypothetical protein
MDWGVHQGGGSGLWSTLHFFILISVASQLFGVEVLQDKLITLGDLLLPTFIYSICISLDWFKLRRYIGCIVI